MTFVESCDRLICEGKCRSDCCGIIPIQKELVNRFRERLSDVNEEVEAGEELFLMTDDFMCAFLDRESRRCRIYDDRPEVCRTYGETKDPRLQCPRLKPNGNPRSVNSAKIIDRDTGRRMKEATKRFESMQRKGDV